MKVALINKSASPVKEEQKMGAIATYKAPVNDVTVSTGASNTQSYIIVGFSDLFDLNSAFASNVYLILLLPLSDV